MTIPALGSSMVSDVLSHATAAPPVGGGWPPRARRARCCPGCGGPRCRGPEGRAFAPRSMGSGVGLGWTGGVGVVCGWCWSWWGSVCGGGVGVSFPFHRFPPPPPSSPQRKYTTSNMLFQPLLSFFVDRGFLSIGVSYRSPNLLIFCRVDRDFLSISSPPQIFTRES